MKRPVEGIIPHGRGDGSAALATILRFHDYELDLAAYQLRRQGRAVRLERRPMEALILLIGRRGNLVTREELIERLWGGKVVIDFETGLNTVIRKIRQALQDPAEQPLLLETVTGKGYRFVAPITEIDIPRTQEAAQPVEARRTLRRPLVVTAAVVIAILVAVAATVLVKRQADSRVTIAVLPFDDLNPSHEYDYLADGLAEDTIASLGQFDPSRLEVIGPASTIAYQRGGKPLADIGRELGADYAVHGSLRTEGTRVRVTATLIRARDQVQLWTAAFDREITSTLGLQGDLSAAIAQQIRIRVSPERSAALASRQTSDALAYDLYLRGLHESRRLTLSGNEAALRFFQQALDRDPHYALAWAGTAFVLSAGPMNSDMQPSTVAERAEYAARQAVDDAPDLAEAQIASAYRYFWLDGHWNKALAGLRRAVELDPNNAMAHMMLGHVLSQLEQQVEARTEMRRARELDPLYPMTYALSAHVAFQARDFAEAQDLARQTIAIAPDFWLGYMQFGQALEQLDELPASLAALEQAIKYSDGNSKPRSLRAYVLARMGRNDEALAVLAEFEAMQTQRYVPPYTFALIYAGLDREEDVRRWLERALEERDVNLGFLPVDPKWDRWRKAPWFISLLQRCEFAS